MYLLTRQNKVFAFQSCQVNKLSKKPWLKSGFLLLERFYLAFWRDFPKLAVAFIRHNIKRAVQTLANIADSLFAFF